MGLGKTMKHQSKPTISPVEFIDRVIKRDEKGEPFSLAPYEALAGKPTYSQARY